MRLELIYGHHRRTKTRKHSSLVGGVHVDVLLQKSIYARYEGSFGRGSGCWITVAVAVLVVVECAPPLQFQCMADKSFAQGKSESDCVSLEL